MCIGGGYRGPAVDPAAEAEAAERKRQNLEERRERKQEALAESVEATTRGTGRRSLITGSGGGRGYFG
jgi:hypothetical protein